MKTDHYIKSLVKYSSISALALSSPLLAIERPTPAAQPEEKLTPPAQKEIGAQPIPMPQVDPQNSPFLGVFGEPIPEVLSALLGLEEGTGIELKIVAPNSPASNAGLQEHDIVTSIDGKNISSIEDLQAAIDQKKPGDEVALNYISKGKPASKKITLGNRTIPRAVPGELPKPDVGQVEPFERGLPEEFLNKFPKNDREKLKELFKGTLRGLDLQELQQGLGNREGFNFNLRPEGLNPEINKGLNFKGEFDIRVKMLDQHGSITLETTKDGKVIELLDKEGKLQYRGPYNNEVDKASVPEDLRKRVENLDIDNGIGFFKQQKIGGFDANEMKMRGLKKLMHMQQMENELMKQFPEGFQERFAFPELLNKDAANMFQLKIKGDSMTTTRTDPATGNRFTLIKDGKDKQVEIYAPSGKLLYNGPYNTEVDKASVPEEFQAFVEKIDKMNSIKNGNRFKLNIGQ